MNVQHWRAAFRITTRRQGQLQYCRVQCRRYSVEAPPQTPPPQPPLTESTILSRSKTFAKWTGILCLSSVIGVFALGGGILAHDAFTYTEKHVDRVPVNPLALHPETGGPKNLPVARVLVDDEEDDEAKILLERPKLVLIGAGWGAMAVLDRLNPGDYHVTVIATDTYTTFTPLQPCTEL